jgi:hypothetical protein
VRTTATSIDHRTLSNLVQAGAAIAADVIGHAGEWGIVVRHGRARQTLASTRGEPRMFRRFETLASYLKGVGITDVHVDLAEYEPAAKDTTSRRGITSAQRLRAAHEAAAYDRWFRAQVDEAVREADDPQAQWVSHDDAKKDWAQQRAQLVKRVKGAAV